jgi:diadenosine tetraphosphate (Ap4A) HIT family hydrolase
LSKCVFCEVDKNLLVNSSDLFYVIRDTYPVTYLHTLIISKRHVETYFALNDEELSELPSVIKAERQSLIEIDKSIKAFNIGMNSGAEAGQTIFHFHVHLIPRRTGDIENPRGGVRGVIPNKQNY